ncbi:lysozyme [Streptomyces sp. A7024]|uniref:Lysozyme n=1 Tax=Streptomyces coryli TaxID=1128680 RepID=A0A6G4U2V9_9ACTN|nr:lysozyme [Streptomyces coryli]NGN66342.1 lysozyme [Streptomyces coryli]
MTPRNGSRLARRTTAGAIATVIASLAMMLGMSSPAAAAPDDGSGNKSTQSPSADQIKPGEAYMGVGVRAHEPGNQQANPITPMATVEGVDVSSHQGNVAWSTLWGNGVRFAYVKATEGTGYKNPYFAQQYNGSYNVGMIRGAYHFALPNKSSGATQANYFVDNGGGWSKDGKTLPGALDIEYNPYGSTCYGLSQSAMRSWITSFINQYKARTGRYAPIYTTTNWWTTCTGNYGGYASNNPLWIARYASSPGTLPAGWGFYTFWQYTSSGAVVGDHNKFNGDMTRLKVLATG